MDLNDEVRKRSSYISRPARPAQPDAQHAGPAAPPGTPSPLPSWSEQPLTAKKSPPEISESSRFCEQCGTLEGCRTHKTGVWANPKISSHVSEESCPRCHKELQDQICLNAECFGGRMTSAGWVDGGAVRIQEAVLAERERCAGIVDKYLSDTGRASAAAWILKLLRGEA